MSHVVAIVGAGTMGSGIAISCLAAGLPVRLIDTTTTALDGARAKIAAHFQRQVDKARMSVEDAARYQAGLTLSDQISAASAATILIEAVFEDLAVKRKLMRAVEPLLADDCVIATNTSCLRVADIATALKRPERLLGLHYFSPAEINLVVELVRSEATAARAQVVAADLLAVTGKEVLNCRDSNGFAINRFFCPYCNEAVRCVEDGLATTGQLDAVARDVFGLALGPFAVMNLTHPRIMLHAERSLAHFGPFYRPAAQLEAVGEAGELWEIETEPVPLSAAAAAIVTDRLKGAVLLAASEAVAEQVVDADDLDRGAQLALRFGIPPGALRRNLGKAEAERLIAFLRQRHDISGGDNA